MNADAYRVSKRRPPLLLINVVRVWFPELFPRRLRANDNGTPWGAE
jgi:hypothetical protein